MIVIALVTEVTVDVDVIDDETDDKSIGMVIVILVNDHGNVNAIDVTRHIIDEVDDDDFIDEIDANDWL